MLETETRGHWQRSKQVLAAGEKLLGAVPASAKQEVQTRLAALQKRWHDFRALSTLLAKWLREAQQANQYFQVGRSSESADVQLKRLCGMGAEACPRFFWSEKAKN